MTTIDPAVTASRAVAEVAARRGFPESVRTDLARRVLDLLGISIAATREPPAHSIRELVGRWGGTPEATAIGYGRVPAPSAALLNGTLAHSLDFDDTHLPSVLHPSASVIPAALAVAERSDASGAEFLEAAAVGIEFVCRLGMAGYDEALGNSVYFERGQHATAICGALGSALAAGMLLGHDTDQLVSTIGIAASMGAGIIEANRTGGTVKRVHCGWAAHAGVTAAEMVSAGLTGPPTALEGRFGFFQAFLGDGFRLDALLDGLGEKWMVEDIFFKPYPCNHFTHAGVDAALRLRAAGVDPSSIERLVLEVPTPVLRTIAEPRAEKIHPRSGYHAAFSGPFTVATALLGGGGLGVFHEDFTDDKVGDPAILALAASVECRGSALCDSIFPHQFPAVLTAHLRDGTTAVERVLVNRGGPQDPLSTDELLGKYHGNADPVVGHAAAATVADTVRGLAGQPSVASLTEVLSGLEIAVSR
ncbi:MmgE/PrpD family protein [Pseudonocardia nematodicida]|uniref:MmgE/PrpD family protein n=1 Tax=Pseudonocardia nematodicida TaxID=1206997 RepID=A0ABV1K5M2_9PSEU